MQEVGKITSYTINTTVFFCCFMGYVLGGTYLSFGMAAILHTVSISIAGLVVFAILPLALMNKIILHFTKRVEITFLQDFLELKITRINANVELNSQTFYYDNIEACSVYSSPNRYSAIYLYTTDNQKYKYTFKNIKSISPTSISEEFFKNIQIRKKDIYLKRTFFATKTGTNYIIGLSVLIVAVIILHVIYAPQTSPFSLVISLSILMSILLRRSNDIRTFHRLTKH